MTEVTINQWSHTMLEFDLEELKTEFREEWAECLINGDTELDFINSIIEEFGLDYLTEFDFVRTSSDDEAGYEVDLF